MTQLFNISINGVDVTNRFSKGSISEEMNRIYDVFIFTVDDSDVIEKEQEVIANYGSKTFTGFVYAVAKTGRNEIRVEVRTYPAKLTEPYSPSETAVDEATTSHDLCALYTSKSGIPITITSENLDFGGSYEREGTMLGALHNIANVTGAEYYDNSGTVIIEPNKAIDSNGIEIPETDIFDFVAKSDSIYNKGVGFITIQNGGDTSLDVVSMNKIHAEIDECTGEIFVFPNPNGTLESTNGVSPLYAATIERKEDHDLLDDDVLTLDGAIESVSSVKLNGSEISDYKFEQGYDTIYFTTTKRGLLEIVYTAYIQRGYTNIKQTPVGRFITFDLYYLDQAIKFQGFLSPDCGNASTDGDMTCIVPADMFYNEGFDVWTIGGDPEFKFYDKNIEILRTVTHTGGNYSSIENVTLEAVGDGTYRYRTRYPLTSAKGARSANVDIPYTTETEDDNYFFVFSQYYPKMTVSYETAGIKHHIQFPTIVHGEITMAIVNNNTGSVCEYDLESKIPCELNQNIFVDIAGELALEVGNIKNRTVLYVDPNDSTHSVNIDEFGFVQVYVFVDGDYTIDTSAMKPKTSITLTVNTEGA